MAYITKLFRNAFLNAGEEFEKLADPRGPDGPEYPP